MKKQLGIILIMGLLAGLAGAARGQDSLNVRKVGEITWSSAIISGVAVSGSNAYVADVSGLYVLDISNPSAPTQVGHWGIWPDDWATDVAVSGSYAYLATHGGGLRVVDISIPSAPVGAGYCDLPGSSYRVVVAGDYAFLADVLAGLRIVNIVDPDNPHEAGFYNNGSHWVYDVAVLNQYAFLAEPDYGLQILDISNPSSPSEISALFVPSWESVAVAGNYAYVGNGNTALWSIDISNPHAPVMAECLPSPGFARNITISSNFVLAAAGNSGLRIINVTNPEIIFESGYYLAGASNDVAVYGNYALLANYYYLGIYDCSAALAANPWEEPLTQPSSFSLHPCVPNPFNAATAISYELRVASHVNLRVYDTAGRLVSTLVDGFRQAGTHEVTFDGSKLASGIYLAKLTAGEFTAVQKLVLLK